MFCLPAGLFLHGPYMERENCRAGRDGKGGPPWPEGHSEVNKQSCRPRALRQIGDMRRRLALPGTAQAPGSGYARRRRSGRYSLSTQGIIGHLRAYLRSCGAVFAPCTPGACRRGPLRGRYIIVFLVRRSFENYLPVFKSEKSGVQNSAPAVECAESVRRLRIKLKTGGFSGWGVLFLVY